MSIDTEKLRELAKRAQSYPGDWQLHTSNSWRRIGTPHADGSVLCPTVARDGHPDLTSTQGTLEYIVAACNAAPGLCDIIDAQAVEIARLREATNWISVSDRLPAPGIPVLVFTPPQSGDYPDDVRIEFDFIDPDSDEPFWHNHGEHYEHFCCIAKGGSDVSWSGPSEHAPYTHWMPLPAAPARRRIEGKS